MPRSIYNAFLLVNSIFKQVFNSFTCFEYRGVFSARNNLYSIHYTKLYETEDTFENLQNTVRILSGLYGILKPMDLIQPYRLEMGTKFPVGKSNNLYQFWSSTITKAS